MEILYFIRLTEAVLALCIFSGLIFIGTKMSPKKVVVKAYELVCINAQKFKNPWWDYDKWDQYLVSNGAQFHYGKWMNPVSYMGLCSVMCMGGFTIGTLFGVAMGIASAIIGALLPGLMLEYLNKRDNEKMLAELDLVYSALSIQIRAGVFVSDALTECYTSVHFPRLRIALEDLCSDLIMNAELENALEKLQKKFNNRYIDTLCITIMQACESGQAVELLGDIAEQIKDMEIVIQQRKKEQLNRSTTFYQLGIFVVCLGLTLYLCIRNMFSASLFFE